MLPERQYFLTFRYYGINSKVDRVPRHHLRLTDHTAGLRVGTLIGRNLGTHLSADLYQDAQKAPMFKRLQNPKFGLVVPSAA